MCVCVCVYVHPCVCVSLNSPKDEELLKTYKSVYSKLLRAEKSAALHARVQLYVDLLQQLSSPPGSEDARA